MPDEPDSNSWADGAGGAADAVRNKRATAWSFHPHSKDTGAGAEAVPAEAAAAAAAAEADGRRFRTHILFWPTDACAYLSEYDAINQLN